MESIECREIKHIKKSIAEWIFFILFLFWGYSYMNICLSFIVCFLYVNLIEIIDLHFKITMSDLYVYDNLFILYRSNQIFILLLLFNLICQHWIFNQLSLSIFWLNMKIYFRRLIRINFDKEKTFLAWFISKTCHFISNLIFFTIVLFKLIQTYLKIIFLFFALLAHLSCYVRISFCSRDF